ncbi:hypothetical protein CHS0354_009474 [Potamilus streckersoni]|uniref:Chitin-binding type-4 domain-containing protein n=1 Tax=Potamilus streckersoni TaxID=2493646 RepID=A0AAE0RVY4_9BIVA|nr:hypothetical protein CHS0354_009474 [Potamilus streckersoni]
MQRRLMLILRKITMFHFGLFCLYWINLINSVSSKAVLIHPPSRQVLWRYGFDTPVNHNYMQGNCGGVDALKRNNRKCGLCGDALGGPQDHDDGGKYSTGVIGQAFTFGIKDIEVMIHLETFSGGYFEFRLCPCDDRFATEECFKRYRLAIREGLQQGNPMRYYPIQSGLIGLTLALPFNMQCNRCVLQWHYVSGRIWGQGPRGSECLDCEHEEYYNCADIRIGSAYNYTFAPPKPSFPPVPKEIKHVSSISPSVAVVNDGVKYPHSVPTPIPPPPSPPQNVGGVILNNQHHPNHEINGNNVAHGSLQSLVVEANKPMPDQTLKKGKDSTHRGHHELLSEITSESSVDSGNKIPRPPPQRDLAVSISGVSNQLKDPSSNSLSFNVKPIPEDPGISRASVVNFNVSASVNSKNFKEKLPSETTVNISTSSIDSNLEKSLQNVNNNIMVSLNASVKTTLNSNFTNINIDNGLSKAAPATHSITPVSSLAEGLSQSNEEPVAAVLPRPKKIIDASDSNFTLNDDVNILLSFVGAIDTPVRAQPPLQVPSPSSRISASHVPSLSPSIKAPLHPPQSQPQPRPPPPPPPSQPLRPPVSPAQPLKPLQPHVKAPVPPQPQAQLHGSRRMTVGEQSQTTHVEISPGRRTTVTNDAPHGSKIQQRPAFNPNIPSRTRFFQPGERQFQPNMWPASGQSAWSTQNRGFGANSWDMPNQQFDGPQPISDTHQPPWSQNHQPQVQWSQRSQSIQFPQRSQHRQQSPRQNQNDIFSQSVDIFSALDEFREFIE